jgi:hypothetical protein
MMVTTPIPQSAGETIADFLSSGVGLLLWRLFILTALTTIAIALAAAGGVYGIIAGIIVGVVLGNNFRNNIADLWHFRFYEV